jgi:hypothetical protein
MPPGERWGVLYSSGRSRAFVAASRTKTTGLGRLLTKTNRVETRDLPCDRSLDGFHDYHAATRAVVAGYVSRGVRCPRRSMSHSVL